MKKLIPWLKAAVSAGLIVFLLKKIDLKNLGESLKGINPLYLFLALGVMFFIITLASLRWRWCLLPQGIDISTGNCLYYSLIGFFFNNFTPSTVGGDVAKGLLVSRFSKKNLGTAISIVVDRLIGLAATGLVALLALLVSLHLPLSPRIRLVILLFTGIVLILLFLILNKAMARKFVNLLSSLHLTRVARKMTSLSEALSNYLSYPRLLKKALVISLLMQISNVLLSYILALGLGIKISFLYFLVFIPLIMAVMSIPISLNGLGLREGAYVVFFNLAGISREQSLAISITYYLVVLMLSLIGGILLAKESVISKKAKLKEEI